MILLHVLSLMIVGVMNSSSPMYDISLPSESIQSDTSFVSLSTYDTNIAYDFRYASDNNFLEQKVYDCVDCLLRKEVADALVEVNAELNHLGYRLKLYDCYRPLSVQEKMWEIYPNANYVANPHTSGSSHNRGGAVDLTLEYLDGSTVDMGTDFDHFGKEAHIDYADLPKNILNNRKMLRTAMMEYGFKPIRTEWWHFYFESSKKYKLSNFQFDCK
ncbi:M15 family metallopeptidase [Aureibacter tunicatorum]|uniref:D-alanyl-D-alanine dipeptidase n=1 Tax=Aureibacter tunicatorum TaxID=866807 RepID=A0AAE4BV73_9BACT|nr:M15 family metallopeptidase [Aureibacter tunicatorum]MDR6241587.1 D-alanyl-D-alanine dipeptidase [Aureibacter tunicatorum]BDD07189.1 D-alanyl-D-alanine dipeptidase [Aureibacter tunicatorum]